MTTVQVVDSEAMENLGRRLAGFLRAGDVVVLNGPLGAGKTTFSRGVGDGLGLETPVQSPTFIVAREHLRSDRSQPPLVHVDAYRLGGADELADLDLDTDRSITLIEWGRGVVQSVATEWLDIDVSFADEAATGRDEPADVPRWVSLTAHTVTGEPSVRWTHVLEELHDSLD